jgi:hypothetical protein
VKSVISIIAKNNLVLATSHSSSEEALMLLREGRRQGARHMVVTHAMNPPIRMSIPQMQEAAKLGAMIEFCYLSILGERPRFSRAQFADAIRQVRPASVVMSTDLGQPANPLPPDGLADYITAMQAEGFSEREISLMTKENPAQLLGLPRNRAWAAAEADRHKKSRQTRRETPNWIRSATRWWPER